MNYFNLGCDDRFQPGWTNVNFTSTGPDGIAYNLTEGIPFSDASFEVLFYYSYILEYLP